MNPKEELRQITELIAKSESYIIVTEKGLAVHASDNQVLTLISMLIKKVISQSNLTKEDFLNAVELASLSSEQLEDLLKKIRNTVDK